MRFLARIATVSVFLIAVFGATAAVAITISVNESQYLIVNGESLKQVDAYVDCDNLMVYWGSEGVDLRPQLPGEAEFRSSPDQDYSQVPFLTTGIAGNTIDDCIEKEKAYYREIAYACRSSLDDEELRTRFDDIRSEEDFALILEYLKFGPYGSVYFKYFSQPRHVCFNPDTFRNSKNLVAPDLCTKWENTLERMAQFFGDHKGDTVRVLLVEGLLYEWSTFRSTEELRDWIVDSPATEHYRPILEELR